jgi:predicted amidophosphoribosyltransferase
MDLGAIAICSNPDCTRHADADVPSDLPETCSGCGSPMLARCWKCETPLTDPQSFYCGRCGIPLKRVLPHPRGGAPLLAVCGNPECDWGIEVVQVAALPSRCPECRTPLVSRCWKCGAGVRDINQHYCQACGVPLKRQLRPA